MPELLLDELEGQGDAEVTLRIPTTIEEARGVVNGLEMASLLRAKGWLKAAIVYAFTFEGKPGPQTENNSSNSGRISFNEFAELKLAGLASITTVSAYHRHWQAAIDAGKATPVSPGDDFEEPELPWGEVHKGASDAHLAKYRRDMVSREPVEVKSRILQDLMTDPQVAPEDKAQVIGQILADKQTRQAVSQDPVASQNVRRAAVEAKRDLGPAPNVPAPAMRLEHLFIRANRNLFTWMTGVNALTPLIGDMTPDMRERMRGNVVRLWDACQDWLDACDKAPSPAKADELPQFIDAAYKVMPDD